MPTFLFDQTIFGPVSSRRLGVSLGINLLPNNRKICSFDCIYCECGLNSQSNEKGQLPERAQVQHDLESKLQEMVAENQLPDVITFAGNGEPTLHPDFASIIDDVVDLRNRYCPKARIAVLSNATRIDAPGVFNALLKVDDNILKLDSGLENTIKLIDRPNAEFNLTKLTDQLQRFHGQLIIQTMFVQGSFNGTPINNTTDADVEAWLQLLIKIQPRQVMIYTIERDTPSDTLKKVSVNVLHEIAEKVKILGIPVQVSG